MAETWLDAVARELGIENEADAKPLLDTARVVAHRVERKATPLTTFLMGIAFGRQSDTDVRDICARVSALADSWDGADADGRTS